MPTAEFKGGASSVLIDVDQLPDVDPPTIPYSPRSLTEQAERTPVTLYVQVEGVGGVDYSMRIEIPAYDDNVSALGRLLAGINEMVFAQDWWG